PAPTAPAPTAPGPAAPAPSACPGLGGIFAVELAAAPRLQVHVALAVCKDRARNVFLFGGKVLIEFAGQDGHGQQQRDSETNSVSHKRFLLPAASQLSCSPWIILIIRHKAWQASRCGERHLYRTGILMNPLRDQ